MKTSYFIYLYTDRTQKHGHLLEIQNLNNFILCPYYNINFKFSIHEKADLPQCPNVDQFNYESMKSTLLERMDLFNAAPFTVQRLCELLTNPKKHYTRLDKFMRALEKNILGMNYKFVFICYSCV